MKSSFYGIFAIVVIVLFFSACSNGENEDKPDGSTGDNKDASAEDEKEQPVSDTLTLTDMDGDSMTLSFNELTEMPAVEGWGGWLTSVGTVEGPDQWKGASLNSLFDLIGGLPAGASVKITARDDYSMNMTAAQATAGDLPVFDPSTKEEIEYDGGISVIVAYNLNGKSLNSEEGPLRLAMVSENSDQITDGHWLIKQVAVISMIEGSAEWSLQMDGARFENMDRATFESGTAPGCHGFSWTDEKANEWTGIPLWLMAGRIDDDNVHDKGAFNRELAAEGYEIQVIAHGGEMVTLQSARVALNNDILLADRVNEAPLDEEHFPLRLVGSDLEPGEMPGKITAIKLVFR